MKEFVKKNGKYMLLSTALIFAFITMSVIREGNSMPKNELYSGMNVLVLLILPVFISTQLVTEHKENNDIVNMLIEQSIIIIVSFIINATILIIVNVTKGFGDNLTYVDISKWLGISILFSVLVLSIANFVGILAKNKITHFLSTFVFLFAPVIIILAFEELLKAVVYGFVGYSANVEQTIAEWPGVKLFSLFSNSTYSSDIGIVQVLIYAIIVAGLSFITYKILKGKNTCNILPFINTYVLILVSIGFITNKFYN